MKKLIEGDPSWESLQGPKHIGKLKSACVDLESVLSAGANDILANDIVLLKRKTDANTMHKKLISFLEATKQIEALEKECNRMQRVHEADVKDL